MITRRGVLKSSAFAFASAMLSKPNLSLAAASNYGIRGRVAPELQVDYWIDENGDPSAFNLADHEGRWIFLKCFQSWCPGCHSHGFPALKKISDALAGNPNIAFAGIQTVFEGHYTNTIDKVRKIRDCSEFCVNVKTLDPSDHRSSAASSRPSKKMANCDRVRFQF